MNGSIDLYPDSLRRDSGVRFGPEPEGIITAPVMGSFAAGAAPRSPGGAGSAGTEPNPQHTITKCALGKTLCAPRRAAALSELPLPAKVARRNGQVSASRFFLWVCLADLVAVLWHVGQLVLSGEQAGGLRGCRWLCGPAGLGTRNCTGECADGPAGGCLCGCIWLCCLGMPCHQELDQGMRRWASWWLALQQPAGGRSQMANGEGREGRWWPVGDWHALSPPRCEQHACTPVSLP